jgi:large subunit ribosomal protein L32e
MVNEQRLKLRKSIKSKKPNFVVKESSFSARVKNRWRFPRGKHSAVRQMHRGRNKLVTLGYGSPKDVKGLHPSGLKPIIINNEKELLSIKEGEGALLSSKLGNKKRLSLLNIALEKNMTLLNFKDIKKAIDKISNEFNARKKVREERIKRKSERHTVKETKKDKKKDVQKELKKEVEETITKRQ